MVYGVCVMWYLLVYSRFCKFLQDIVANLDSSAFLQDYQRKAARYISQMGMEISLLRYGHGGICLHGDQVDVEPPF